MDLLAWSGRHAKWVLASGLVIAILLPSLARTLSQHLTPMICAIMFIGAARLRPSEFPSLLISPFGSVLHVLLMQLGLPALAAAVFWFCGLHEQLFAKTIILLLAASAIVSSPNFAAIMKLDVAISMRLLFWSTVLVPLTSLPIFVFLFGDAALQDVLWASLRLVVIITVSGSLGLAFRWFVLPCLSDQGEIRLDGVSAIALAIFVIALMPEITSIAFSNPILLTGWIALAFAMNFGTQVITLRLASKSNNHEAAGAFAIAYGNRNLALFFAALPLELSGQFIVFLAAYQLPMYLTPMLLAGLYKHSD
ncbi:MAG: hypothetical protein AAGA97_07040 [Pseudomonadota bacterium]